MTQGWKKYLFYSSIVLVVVGLIYILVETVKAERTGFETKTLWDWMELLIIPAVLAGGAIFLNRSERKTEREIANDRQQEAALQTYFDRMSELLLTEKLRTTKKAEVRDVARTRTISIMRGLDTKRNNLILQFLSEANLITDENSIFNRANMSRMNLQDAFLRFADLQGANLQGAFLRAANLQHANLRSADMQGADLRSADLRGANLQGTDLRGANLSSADLFDAGLQDAFLKNSNLQDAFLNNSNLQGANLSGVNLQGADLRGADFRGAELKDADLQGANLFVKDFDVDLFALTNITEKQLASVKSLKGATMPDGTKHE